MKNSVIFLVAALALVGLAIVTAPAQGAVKISGYVQGRYVNNEAAEPVGNFLVRRARIKASGHVSENAEVVCQIDLSRTVTLKDAAAAWGRQGWRLEIGQAKVPFGYEILESSSVRLPLERAKVLTTLFEGERDRGVFLSYKPEGQPIPLILRLAVVNGNGPNREDNNNHKNLAFRVEGKPVWGNFGASYYTGDFFDADTGVTTAAVRSGVDFLYRASPLALQGELVGGRNEGESVQGWYVQGAYELPNKPCTVFARRDEFDPNIDGAGDAYKRTTIGMAHNLDEATEVTVQYEFITDPATAGDDNSFGLQMQVKY